MTLTVLAGLCGGAFVGFAAVPVYAALRGLYRPDLYVLRARGPLGEQVVWEEKR